MEENIFAENLLRRLFQCSDKMGINPVTTSDVQDILIKHGHFLETEPTNELMEKVGFQSVSIPNEADKIWLVEHFEN